MRRPSIHAVRSRIHPRVVWSQYVVVSSWYVVPNAEDKCFLVAAVEWVAGEWVAAVEETSNAVRSRIHPGVVSSRAASRQLDMLPYDIFVAQSFSWGFLVNLSGLLLLKRPSSSMRSVPEFPRVVLSRAASRQLGGLGGRPEFPNLLLLLENCHYLKAKLSAGAQFWLDKKWGGGGIARILEFRSTISAERVLEAKNCGWNRSRLRLRLANVSFLSQGWSTWWQREGARDLRYLP